MATSRLHDESAKNKENRRPTGDEIEVGSEVEPEPEGDGSVHSSMSEDSRITVPCNCLLAWCGVDGALLRQVTPVTGESFPDHSI